LVVKGFNQKQGIDFEDIFSPVVKMTSIRAVLGLVATMNLEVEQLDVKTAFLHGDLEEEIYMEQPEDLNRQKQEDAYYRTIEEGSPYRKKRPSPSWRPRILNLKELPVS